MATHNADYVAVYRSDLEVVLSQISHASGRYGLAVIRLQAALDDARIDEDAKS